MDTIGVWTLAHVFSLPLADLGFEGLRLWSLG